MATDATSMQLVPEGQFASPPPNQEGWGNTPTLTPPKSPLERPIAAVRRYRWLCAVVVVLSTIGGVIATRFVHPDYESKATLMIASMAPQEAGGPIRSRELLNPAAWIDLLKSYRIADAVVRKLGLYAIPLKDEDAGFVRQVGIGERYFPGSYTLRVDRRTKKWKLTIDDISLADSGIVGDSIGRPMGLRWQPDLKSLARVADRDVKFVLSTQRETSAEMMRHLSARMPVASNFLNLSFVDKDPKRASQILQTLAVEYVTVAADLKKGNMTQFAQILGRQLEVAETSLKNAESALETFKINTITQPTEGGGPVASGLQYTEGTVLSAFFSKKIAADELRHDREELERAIGTFRPGSTPSEAILMIPSVAGGLGGDQLRQSFAQLYKQQEELTRLRSLYKDDYQPLREKINEMNTLQNVTIPAQANALLAQLRQREGDIDQRIGVASTDLQSIPVRTIEEMRLKRTVTVAEGLYGTLKQRFAEATLSEASSAPDINILDSAGTPQHATKNTAPGILAAALIGGLAGAIGLAILLDTLDKRIRYPEQATKELGLTISGAVPELQKGSAQQTPEQISQLIESFRTLRMNVMNSSGAQVAMAVSSPSPGDGKSFIASNLAMSFADAGFRTCLVDGDTRRGALHDMFGLARTPGLTDFLSGDAVQHEIIHATGHENLSLVPTGTLRRRSPELLTSPALGRLVTELKRAYDVLIFDTPPFAAGVDGYAIAAATGNLLVVLRIGQTERRMAAAKLLLVDRLPINVIGSVLNAAPTQGEYEYYGYVSGYAAEDVEAGQQVAEVNS